MPLHRLGKLRMTPLSSQQRYRLLGKRFHQRNPLPVEQELASLTRCKLQVQLRLGYQQVPCQRMMKLKSRSQGMRLS